MPKTKSKKFLKRQKQKEQFHNKIQKPLSEKNGWVKYRVPDYMADDILSNLTKNLERYNCGGINFGPNCVSCKPYDRGYPKEGKVYDYIGCSTHNLCLSTKTQGIKVQFSIKPMNKFVILIQWYNFTLFVLYFNSLYPEFCIEEECRLWKMSNWMCTCPYSCGAFSRKGRQGYCEVDWYSNSSSLNIVSDEVFSHVTYLSQLNYSNEYRKRLVIKKQFGCKLIVNKIMNYIQS